MIAYELLKNDDKEELIQRIISLDQENEKLRKEIEELKEQIKKPSQKEKKSESLKKAKKKSKPPHEWGRKAGHPGCTRPKPDHIDREVSQELNRCPKCNEALGKPIGVIEHIQEDIIPSRVEVTHTSIVAADVVNE